MDRQELFSALTERLQLQTRDARPAADYIPAFAGFCEEHRSKLLVGAEERLRLDAGPASMPAGAASVWLTWQCVLLTDPSELCELELRLTYASSSTELSFLDEEVELGLLDDYERAERLDAFSRDGSEHPIVRLLDDRIECSAGARGRERQPS